MQSRDYFSIGYISYSQHIAKKPYTCNECDSTIEPGEKYTYKSEKINEGYWHKTRICGKCKASMRTTLKNTQMRHVNRPIGDEWWVVEIDGEREVIQLASDYREEWTYYQSGNDVMMCNKSTEGYNHARVKFIRKVFIDD